MVIGQKVKRSQDHKVTRSQGHKITRSKGQRIKGSKDHREWPAHTQMTLCANFFETKMSQPISLSFGIKVFKQNLEKAQKWEIEKKIKIEALSNTKY